MALALAAAGCLGSETVVSEESLNASAASADGGSDSPAVDNGGEDRNLNPDRSDVALDVATDSINPSDTPVDGVDAADANDAPMAVDVADASDTPPSGDVTDVPDVPPTADVPDASDVPAPRCGDMSCTPASGETCSSCPTDCGSCTPRCGDMACNGTETCTSCAMDCGSCPVDGGTDVSDVTAPPDHGPDASDAPSPTDTPDVPPTVDTPDASDVPAPRCGDMSCTPASGETCTTCATDCGPCAPRCGDMACNGMENCLTCSTDCSSGYPALVQEYTGTIGAAMASVDIRLRNASGPAVTAYRTNPCVGGLTPISGGFRCVVDIATLMGVCGSPMPTGTHLVFRDRAGNRLLTNRVPGTPGAPCYASAGSVPCIRSTSSGRPYTEPIYTGFAGETDSQGDVLFYNLGVEAPEIR
jgi:hypothetical protein